MVAAHGTSEMPIWGLAFAKGGPGSSTKRSQHEVRDGAARKELQSHVRPLGAEIAQNGGQLAAVGGGIRESNEQAPDLALSYKSGAIDTAA
jgi:hypothetical protein